MCGPCIPFRLRARRGAALVLACAALVAVFPSSAFAVPAMPTFGPRIEDYASYRAQRRCKPRPKPGVLAFQQLLEHTYPASAWFAISRGCDVGGQSEHKEGRALDWSRDASVPAERWEAKDLLAWLLATDGHGNGHAMVRRLGIMYLVWNRRIWSTWEQGWGVYCVQRARKCKDPDSKAILDPHTDHVHFSFGWPGARMNTSFWNPEFSQG